MARKSRRAKRRNRILTVLILLLAVAVCVSAPLILDALEVEYYPELTIEAGQPLPAAGDFFPVSEKSEKKQATFLTDMKGVDPKLPGSYPLQLGLRGNRYDVVLVIKDTTPPVAQAQDLTVYNPDKLNPEDFIVGLEDATEVQVTFTKQPDLTAKEQQVELDLIDAGGNTLHLQAKLTLIHDTQAPQIKGVKDLFAYVGGSIAYRAGVTAVDDLDQNVQLEVDSAGVDLTAPGDYKVTYKATDHAGNITTVTVKVTVAEKGEDYVEPDVIYERIDSLMAKFISDDMTDREKVEAVYCWTRLHFQYGKSSTKTDYMQVAYEFLQTHTGDCVSYFSLQKLMLERLGIPTIDVSKVKNFEGDSNHYWLLVSIDQGKSYYHFDNVWSKQLCLVTDKRLNAFSRACKNCFNRDESLYPATPTEDLPYSALPWNDPDICNTKP